MFLIHEFHKFLIENTNAIEISYQKRKEASLLIREGFKIFI